MAANESNGALATSKQQPPSKPTADGETPKKASKAKELWQKIGLDIPTLSVMLKGSLPPTIAIALYQSKNFAAQYSTLGYLVAITSIGNRV